MELVISFWWKAVEELYNSDLCKKFLLVIDSAFLLFFRLFLCMFSDFLLLGHFFSYIKTEKWPTFYLFFITSIAWLPINNGSIVFVQNFLCRVITWFICKPSVSPESKQCNFWKLVCTQIYVCVCVWLYGEYLALYFSKINKYRNSKFYAQYQTST